MSILVVTDFSPAEWKTWWPSLQAALPDERLVIDRGAEAAGEIDVALVANPPPGELKDLPGLKLIQSLWAGVDKLLADPTVPEAVPLARMVDPAMSQAMAETALWAVLSLHRDFYAYATLQQQGRWQQGGQLRADEVKVAVLGLGEMGAAVAQRLAANGYSVIGWSRHGRAVGGVTTLAGAATLPQVLATADVVVNLLPLTPATRHLFNAERFGEMKRGASFVNLGRGAQVIENDLLKALETDHLRHAVLDVFQTEPLPTGHSFWRHPCVTVLPHVAAQTDPRSAAQVVAANVRALRAGAPLAHLVDRQRGY